MLRPSMRLGGGRLRPVQADPPHQAAAIGTGHGRGGAAAVAAVAAAVAALAEAWLYVSGSRRSRLRQVAALRDLDDRLRSDIGLPRRPAPAPADPWLDHRLPRW